MSSNRYIIENIFHGKRLDWWLKKKFFSLNFHYIEKLIRTGQVRVNGGRVKPSHKLTDGEEVRLPPFIHCEVKPKINNRTSSLNLSERVLYCDENLIVIDKPYGLAVQGGSKIIDSVDSMLDSLNLGPDEDARLVHRIDKNTSGVLMIARNLKASKMIQEKFFSSKIKKLYWAVVFGRPKSDYGVIDLPLKKKFTNKYEKVMVDANGDEAFSIYKVIETRENFSWLLLSPVTGRTHQLRVHCAEIGCPIVGDKKYSMPGLKNNNSKYGFNKTQLFSRKVILEGECDEKILVEAPLPSHMRSIFNYIGFKKNCNELYEIEKKFEKKIYNS